MRAYERLLRYAAVHTTSDPDSGAAPSSARQLDLAHLLEDEMKQLGLEGVHTDAYGICYGFLSATPGMQDQPAIGFIAHLAPAQEKKEAPEGPNPQSGPDPQGDRIWQETLRKLKQKPQLYGMARFGRLASAENGLFTVVYDKATGGAYVRVLSMKDKNEEITKALSAAAGYPCQFRAAIEGTVAERDENVLRAQEEARTQSQQQLGDVFGVFGRENVRVVDD